MNSITAKVELSYFTDLQGSQTSTALRITSQQLSYFTDLQGSQTGNAESSLRTLLSYFTDLQGSQTVSSMASQVYRLVTLLIYKVLKHC